MPCLAAPLVQRLATSTGWSAPCARRRWPNARPGGRRHVTWPEPRPRTPCGWRGTCTAGASAAASTSSASWSPTPSPPTGWRLTTSRWPATSTPCPRTSGSRPICPISGWTSTSTAAPSGLPRSPSTCPHADASRSGPRTGAAPMLFLACIEAVARQGLAGRLGATVQANFRRTPADLDRLVACGRLHPAGQGRLCRTGRPQPALRGSHRHCLPAAGPPARGGRGAVLAGHPRRRAA